MPLRRTTLASLVVLAATTAPANAQMAGQTAAMDHAAPACTGPTTLPPVLQSWRTPKAATGGTTAKDAPLLVRGQAVTMALSQTPQVRYALRPEKPGGSVSFGGLAGFTVKQAGTWRVALGSGAWVDVVRNGKAATSVAHGHGSECSGVRKMVDYQLTPGTYTLQVAGSGEKTITLLVTPLP